MRIELLNWIIAQAAPKIGPQYPHGWMTCPASQRSGAEELQSEELVIAYVANAAADGSFPVTPTDAGMLAAKTHVEPEQPVAPAVQAVPQPFNFNVKVEDGIPVPAARQRGFQSSEGGNAIDRFGFDHMQVGQSFHLPPSGDPEKPSHRVFSNTVSQANRKLWPKKFLIREVGKDDPAGAGARIWRASDETGQKPEPKPRKKAEAVQAAPQAGQPVPFAPQPAAFDPGQGFGGAVLGHAPPAGFGAPQGGFGGQGFPEPGPGGFAPPGGWQGPS